LKNKEQKKKGNFTFLFKIMLGNWRFFWTCVITMALGVGLSYITPKIVGVTIDSVIGTLDFNLPQQLKDYILQLGGRDFLLTHLFICGLLVFAVAVFSAVFNYIRNYSGAQLAQHLSYKLRKTLFGHIQRLPFSWHKSIQTGDIMQRCSSDVDTICNFVSGQFTDVVRIVFMLVIAYVLMFSINTKLALACLAFVPVVIGYSGGFYGRIAKRFLLADEAEGRMHAIAQENFTGVRVVKAFGRERQELDRFMAGNDEYANLWIKTGELLGWYWSIGDLISASQTALLLIYGTFLTVHGEMSPGEIIVFVMYGGMLAWPMRRLGRTLGEMSKAGVSIGRINEILSVKAEQDEETDLSPEIKGDIKYEHVNFGFDNAEVLRDVSFELKAGQTLAILGGTGSGKSTLLHLLNRLYDLDEEKGQGKITIDGIGINKISRRHLRRNIAMVLQEPFLFSDTIDNNLKLAAPETTHEDIESATCTAEIHNSILEFPKGYETLIGEKGVTLSGGQRQRVAIARALVEDAPVLVFDDSLSAVDVETDSKIRSALKKRTKDTTTIIISHRISTLMDADVIMVLSEGKIAEMGNHAELLKLNGIYSSIFNIQSMFEEEMETEVGANGGGNQSK